ncbi:MAG: ABC transporter ATP-binding protein [SAR202 cluster bacterium]|nr:ABC transporter ATP-binding protein [SAR202 cluster bacterium]|tara:strand:+ start:34229 stop:35314 length:1086 start_codon:yes stop_codon:yes gene_type:complete
MNTQSTYGCFEVIVGGFKLSMDLEVQPGTVLVLFGSSGSGKTTVLRTIAGLLTPSEGVISIGGVEVFNKINGVNIPSHKRKVGYVPQDMLVFPHLTVIENIAYGIRNYQESDNLIETLVEKLDLNGLEDRYEWELSGGQRQRVALARALAPDPRLLLLDEAFSSLDSGTRSRTRSYVRQILQSIGIPVIMVTHDKEEAVSMGDRLAIIESGGLVELGDPVSMIGHPARERVANLLGVENVLSLKVKNIFPDQGIMECVSESFSLEIPVSNDVLIGQDVRIGLRADDVILASVEPGGLSARNIKKGIIKDIYIESGMYRIEIDCGHIVISHVTKRAVDELGLISGSAIWCVIKSASCFVLQD